MQAGPVLREYQRRGVQIFETLPRPARYFFAWDMGAGKTLGAISVARTFARNKCLVVCPAIVRENWAREIRKHWPEVSVGVIAWGRTRNGLSKAQVALREEAYNADVQIISYDLLKQVRPTGWDMVIVDEFHNLRSCMSQQSKWVRVFLKANPEAWALGLSGTPIPNEAKQLWNPVDTFFPGVWGKQTRKDMEPYPFVKRFCLWEESDYGGGKFYGLRPEKRAELEEAFAKISMRVVQEDFAEHLPPLFVEPLYINERVDPVAVARDWYKENRETSAHVGIYTHLRETAAKIDAALGARYLVTGNVPPKCRDQMLEECRIQPKSLLVGTTHALKEGISLSFQKTALVVEWTTRVDEVVQFIARFARQDSTSKVPTRVQFVVGPSDHGRAEILSQRIADIQSVVKASRADKAAAGVFAAQEMSDEDFQSQLSNLIAQHEKRAVLWSASEDDDDEED